MGKVIGIDLGTTNSCVAVVEGGKPVVITNAEGERTTPSVVAFTKDGERLVGGAAKRQLATNAGRTISSIKRRMGSDYRVHIDGKDLTPQEISAMILSKLRRDAESYLGEKVTEAVITVPAYFDDSQRKATQDAGRIAGLNVLRIINEPTAAAVAYGLDNEAAQKILVYDLGGGTFDVSIIEIEDGAFTVLATGGDTRLGGDDFDARIVDWLVQEFKKSDRIDLSRDPAAMGRLKEEAEKAKKELSSAPSAQINLPFIAVGRDGPHHIDVTLTRPQFEMMTGDLLARTVEPVNNALRDAGLSAADLGRVLLVGGSTRMPAVARQVKELLGKEPSHALNPDECVAMGAAIQGGLLQGGGKLAGATGAAAQGLVLMDVTPLTLSIETLGGVATPLIARNSMIPTRKSQIFTTARPMQTSVEINVLQGERRFAKDNKSLGKFKLGGIRAGFSSKPLRHRRQRRGQGLGQGPGHRPGAEHHHHRLDQPLGERDPAGHGRRRRLRGGGQPPQGPPRAAQPGRDPGLQGGRGPLQVQKGDRQGREEPRQDRPCQPAPLHPQGPPRKDERRRGIRPPRRQRDAGSQRQEASASHLMVLYTQQTGQDGSDGETL